MTWSTRKHSNSSPLKTSLESLSCTLKLLDRYLKENIVEVMITARVIVLITKHVTRGKSLGTVARGAQN